MTWNIAAESISIVFLSIIWGYSRKGSLVPSLKNRCFQACFLITFCAMITNIISTLMLKSYLDVPLWMIWLVTTVYFVFTPLMGLVYFYYTAAVIYENRKGLPRVLVLTGIPSFIYLFLVFLNPITKNLFDINREQGYVQGPLISITYILFYMYCIFCVILVLVKGKWLNQSIYRILVVFPLIAVLVIIFQQFFPSIILSGSAATCALLIIYLYLQNKQISIDYLTNIPNRQELLHMIELLLRRPIRPSFAIIVISLRDFKHINDTYGQQNGDQFLRAICLYLTSVSEPRTLYRFNGDEFAILSKDSSREKLVQLTSVIQDRMKLPWEIPGCRCIIPVAIGIARYPDSSKNLEGLIHGIEYAVSRAKSANKDGICYCDQKMLDEIQRKHQIVEILKEVCANNSFELYYQPILDVSTGRYLFAESLMRLNHTPLGPIYPSEFIPLAEESGLIVELTYHILDKVCKFINRLAEQHIDIERIHVNFSAIQFSQPDLIERVCETIQRNGTPYSKIKIEFTESAIADNPQVVSHFVDEMHQLGIRLGLDDFGVGYSNLDTVVHIPFDTIKLDKSLVWSATEQEKSAIMVRNITNTFLELGMKVLAEGVETPEQDAFVRDCGIHMIQGYLYARPITADETEEFLRSSSCHS